jgi:predicted transcriptional regulator
MWDMAERRPMGALEAEVMACLWAAKGPTTPAVVRDKLPQPLAYTTVSTILVRLWQKGLVSRERNGKAFLYTSIVGEADLAAQRMHQALQRTGDHRAALSRFVDTLTVREAKALRQILGQLDAEP